MITRLTLPVHASRRYDAVGRCIYCGSADKLSDEHIIPYALGGEWLLPKASCSECSKITSAFEGEFARTILGPLRMLYNMPTRRPKDRPKHLPLKVKYPRSTDWEIAYVDRSVCPFLIGMPLYPLPDRLTGLVTTGARNQACNQLWIRGGGFRADREAHMEWLCHALGAREIMPAAQVTMEAVCLTVMKIAHAFAVAELGPQGFEPFLPALVRGRDLANRADFVGGGAGNEPACSELHDVAFDPLASTDPNIIAVKVRMLGVLEMPTYHVAVGRRLV